MLQTVGNFSLCHSLLFSLASTCTLSQQVRHIENTRFSQPDKEAMRNNKSRIISSWIKLIMYKINRADKRPLFSTDNTEACFTFMDTVCVIFPRLSVLWVRIQERVLNHLYCICWHWFCDIMAPHTNYRRVWSLIAILLCARCEVFTVVSMKMQNLLWCPSTEVTALLLGLLDPEVEGIVTIRNVGNYFSRGPILRYYSICQFTSVMTSFV